MGPDEPEPTVDASDRASDSSSGPNFRQHRDSRPSSACQEKIGDNFGIVTGYLRARGSAPHMVRGCTGRMRLGTSSCRNQRTPGGSLRSYGRKSRQMNRLGEAKKESSRVHVSTCLQRDSNFQEHTM
jgi:hypothetical protein